MLWEHTGAVQYVEFEPGAGFKQPAASQPDLMVAHGLAAQTQLTPGTPSTTEQWATDMHWEVEAPYSEQGRKLQVTAVGL